MRWAEPGMEGVQGEEGVIRDGVSRDLRQSGERTGQKSRQGSQSSAE